MASDGSEIQKKWLEYFLKNCKTKTKEGNKAVEVLEKLIKI